MLRSSVINALRPLIVSGTSVRAFFETSSTWMKRENGAVIRNNCDYVNFLEEKKKYLEMNK